MHLTPIHYKWASFFLLSGVGFIVCACSVRYEQPPSSTSVIVSPSLQPTSSTSVIVSPSFTEDSSPVSLVIGQKVYLSGEEIHFQVTNHLENPIYYNYGCHWPNPYKLEFGERIDLTVSIILEYPPTKQLSPGETHDCTWNQTAWIDPQEIGQERYKSFVRSELVPPGQYELGFFYYPNEEVVGYGDQAIAVWSGPFYIE